MLYSNIEKVVEKMKYYKNGCKIEKKRNSIFRYRWNEIYFVRGQALAQRMFHLRPMPDDPGRQRLYHRRAGHFMPGLCESPADGSNSVAEKFLEENSERNHNLFRK
jgi:hypothetical protein